METVKQKISRSKNSRDFEKILKSIDRWDVRDADYILRRMIYHRIVPSQPNIFITLNSKKTLNWALSEDDKVKRYRELQRSVGLFIKHFAKAILPKYEFDKEYEKWFPFFAFFEDIDKSGEPCNSHFHILMSLPSEYVDLTVNSTELRDFWLNHIRSDDNRDYDCALIEDDIHEVCKYVTKFSGNDISLDYSISNENFRAITSRVPRLKRGHSKDSDLIVYQLRR